MTFESDYEAVLMVKARRDRLDTAIASMAADSERTHRSRPQAGTHSLAVASFGSAVERLMRDEGLRGIRRRKPAKTVDHNGSSQFLGQLASVASSSWFVAQGYSRLHKLRDDLDGSRCVDPARAIYQICPSPVPHPPR